MSPWCVTVEATSETYQESVQRAGWQQQCLGSVHSPCASKAYIVPLLVDMMT
jgi:hypothetical protein